MMTTCQECKGHGKFARHVRTPFGVRQTESQCEQCHGEGKCVAKKDRCKACRGEGMMLENKILQVIVDKVRH